jgi:hypothetical protein
MNPQKIISIIKKLTLIAAAVVLIHVIHALTLDRIIEYTEVSFSRGQPDTAPYTIAFISDTHAISERRLNAVVDELNSRGIDMLLLGGDYSANGGKSCMEILSRTETADGIFGVDGNHDNHTLLFENMQANNIMPLSNAGVRIHDGFFLAGVADIRRRACIKTAVSDATSDDFVLLVSHNPDISMQQFTTGVDLILSGHTHGGQITFFGLWAPALILVSDYGHMFKGGFADFHDGAQVYTSRGTGEYMPRIFARPQVVILTLS